MAALVQTIAVVDKSGKAVSTSKHLINVFKEAKSAYQERKAEIVAGRQIELEGNRARQSLQAHTIDDDGYSLSSRRRHTSSKRSSHRPTSERNHTSPSLRSSVSPRTPKSTTSPRTLSPGVDGSSIAPMQLIGTHTVQDRDFSLPPTPSRTMTSPTFPVARRDDIDMDLAYGPIPPPLPVVRVDEEAELKGLVKKAKKLLEEADCIHASASATIANLQKNPDAMAAVALTLAEISNIASKMAPGALIAMKGSAPAVFALLASPQFLIAGGVAVGVTIVALGGYKVIKRIKARHAAKEESMEEMLEIGGDISHIDNWRRGIAEVEAQSVGTSVDGELITPQAAALSSLSLAECGIEPETSKGKNKSDKEKPRKASGRTSSSEKSGGSERSAKSEKESKKKELRVKRTKEKKPSPLRLMFQ